MNKYREQYRREHPADPLGDNPGPNLVGYENCIIGSIFIIAMIILGICFVYWFGSIWWTIFFWIIGSPIFILSYIAIQMGRLEEFEIKKMKELDI